MRPPPTLKIIEIFPSVQGEGLRQGEPTLFIRLAGCNLRCSFCDTAYALKEGSARSWQDILEDIRRLRGSYPARWICLTGGEPLLQDVCRLLRELKNEGFMIQVETNGTIDRLLPVDWYTVSPKPPRYFYQPRFLKTAKEVKIVASRELTFETVLKLRKEFPRLTPLLLQPESGRQRSIAKALKILERSLQEGLENIRISGQLHKAFRLH